MFSVHRAGRTNRLRKTILAMAVLVVTGAGAQTAPYVIETISTHADRVSGGDVLVKVTYNPVGQIGPLVIKLNNVDATGQFRAGSEPNTMVGLVRGLAVGPNTLRVLGKSTTGIRDQSLQITNYDIKGPIISGPYESPFICQTASFNLPAGLGNLGAPLDANCSIATRVDYLYISTAGGAFRAMPSRTALPADVAMTTTLDGKSVPFVVRLETATINRGIFQSVVLHDPTTEPEPHPVISPPKAWNKRLLAIHGTGCPGGWYIQGAAQGVNPVTGVNITRLGEGWGIFINTLQFAGNNCNILLNAETAMMGKEHVIETFGVPRYTISIGTSGGAIATQDLADVLPGLFDGAIPQATFPDSITIANNASDARLLTNFLIIKNPSGWTDAQKVAVSGYSGIRALLDDANESQRIDPVAGRVDFPGYEGSQWSNAVPVALRYNPVTNPTGARPTVYDVSRNLYGIDPATGFARRPWDNVGVQYGLQALNAGVISKTQFLDLNEFIGGYDNDANYVPNRTSGDLGALTRMQQGGAFLSGTGGMSAIPVLDGGAYNDTSAHHYAVYHFAVRERLRQANGDISNHVMWRGPAQNEPNWQAMVRWVEAIKADHSNLSPHDKVRVNKPADIVDGCWNTATNPPTFIAETQIFSSLPTTQCTTLYPAYSLPRIVAGGPLALNNMKCQLKPVTMADYTVSFTTDESLRLVRIFPNGVCDWSKPAVNFTNVVTWPSFGPSPDNLVYDVTHP